MKNRILLKSILTALLCLFICFITSLNYFTNFVYAEEVIDLETSDVLEDLNNSTIGGKPFKLKDYPENAKGKTQLICFAEYCYSNDSEKLQDYALFVYVYNPTGFIFSSSNSNAINISTSENGSYNVYNLKIINYSRKTGYEALFYKFKVELTNEQKQSFVNSFNGQSERLYKISQVVLSRAGKLERLDVVSSYRYSGFAKDYGSDNGNLSCKVDGFDKYLTLNVKSTYYRPDGNNGKNDYTQDSLHSVYFAVPNKDIVEYGEMTAVHARWLNAVLQPSLVTGNAEAYAKIKDFVGRSDIAFNNDSLPYCYIGDKRTIHISTGDEGGFSRYGGNFGFNVPTNIVGNFSAVFYEIDKPISPLYFLYKAPTASILDLNTADHYTVSHTLIEKQLNDLTKKFGGEKVLDRYSSCLFSSVDSEFTDMNIRKDEQFNVFGQKLNQSWWQKLWGIENYETVFEESINAIERVEDFGNMSNLEISTRYLVALSDVNEFKDYCATAKNKNETVYLFRYRVSEFVSEEVELYKYKNILGSISLDFVDTNAYVFQQAVDLDFSIIDLTFTKDNQDTIIPVLMTPMDIIYDATPPLDTKDDKGGLIDWLKLILIIFGIVVLVVLLSVFSPILAPIFKTVISVVLLPINLIINAIKKRKK